MEFRISFDEKRQRFRKLIAISLLSIVLIALLWLGNPEVGKDLTSILAGFTIPFLIVATGYSWYRHKKYLTNSETHKIVVMNDRVIFWQTGEATELKIKAIYRATTSAKNGQIRSLKLQLKNGRNILLKGYENMSGLSESITQQLPQEIVEST